MHNASEPQMPEHGTILLYYRNPNLFINVYEERFPFDGLVIVCSDYAVKKKAQPKDEKTRSPGKMRLIEMNVECHQKIKNSFFI